jgi:hypothetical protein
MGFTLTMENTALQQPEVQSQQLSLVLPHLWRAIWLGSLRMILSMQGQGLQFSVLFSMEVAALTIKSRMSEIGTPKTHMCPLL